MLFGFGHLVSVMSAIHDRVDPAIVEARLKYLQRVPFPAPRGDVGKGGRTYYSADDLLRLVIVFELVAASVLPAQAAALVTDRWGVIGRGLLRAWDRMPDGGASVVMIATPNTFDVEGDETGRVDIVDADELVLRLRSARRPGRRTAADRQADHGLARRFTLVDLTALVTTLDAVLPADSPRIERAAMRGELEAWLQSSRPLPLTGT